MIEKSLQVAVITGSKSDLDTIQKTVDVLKKFGVSYEVKVLSAHRTPRKLAAYVEKLPSRGAKVVIAAAGMSAALAGTVAAHTSLPVIGVPMETRTLQGLDSLLSTVQMPKGVPVGCMSIGSAGACNAGLYACQILALNDKKISGKLTRFRSEMAKSIMGLKIKL